MVNLEILKPWNGKPGILVNLGILECGILNLEFWSGFITFLKEN